MPNLVTYCDWCGKAMEGEQNISVVSTPRGYYFFHKNRDCQQLWEKKKQEKKHE